MIDNIWSKLKVDSKTLTLYIIVYFIWGVIMHNIGDFLEIARFKYWWQIITCYLFYMIPVSLLLREYRWYEQYAYGLFFMGILELGGYAMGSSIMFEDNFIATLFTEKNFALAMTLFFGTFFLFGNWMVYSFRKLIFGRNEK